MKKSLRKKLISVAIVVVALCCILVEYGDELGLPNWQDVLSGVGLSDNAPPAEGTLEVHVIDVGNADALLVRQEDKAMLIDAGERGDGDEILDYLSSRGVERLDLVIATHPHADHIGGMADVIREVEIGEFLIAYMPEKETPTTAVYLDMLEALVDRDVTVTEAVAGDIYALGTAELTVLAPLTEDDDPNAMSVVTRLSFGENRFLFMGDAEREVEHQILQSGRPVSADVLKVGHHGSNTGTHDKFLERVSPDYAILTCGEGNSYGHPHREVVAKLKEASVATYRSDLHGHIVFVSDGKSITVKTQKGAA